MWSKAKNGLVHPRKQGRTSPFLYCENTSFQEILRGNKRKSEVRYEPSFWSECKERSDGIANLRASKTSRSAERGRRRQNLRCPPPSHSLLFVGRTRRITQYTASGMRRIKTNSTLPNRCSRRFRCGKNSYQLFLPCYPTTPSMPPAVALGLAE